MKFKHYDLKLLSDYAIFNFKYNKYFYRKKYNNEFVQLTNFTLNGKTGIFAKKLYVDYEFYIEANKEFIPDETAKELAKIVVEIIDDHQIAT